MNKKTTLVWLSAIPLGLLIFFARNNPQWVETFYSRLFYPLSHDLHHFFFGSLPFSVGDIGYIVLILACIGVLRKNFYHWKVKPLKLLYQAGSIIILGLWIFHLSWGLNYHRLPLHQQMLLPFQYNKGDLENTFEYLIKTSNTLHLKLVDHDTLAVVLPYSKTHIQKHTPLYHPGYHETILNRPKAKKSLLSLPLSYMGFAGYLNPFTLESQVNAMIPPMSWVTTTLHERAHQLGYASEKEANFIAYYSAIINPDTYIQYTGYTFGLRYLYTELYKIDPEGAKEKIKTLHTGIFKNYKQISDFWKQYQNPFEVVFDKTYDGYLKANGQASGIKSYNEMVGLIVNYHKNQKQF